MTHVPDFLRSRVLADSHDRISWLKARSFGITATDAAHLATPRSVEGVVRSKCDPHGFSGNAYTDYGREREPVIAEWMRQNFGLHTSTVLFRSDGNARHLATPDGINECNGCSDLLLAEIKTSTKPIEKLPRTYLRQIWWQQYVMGAQRTLLVWEQHENFRPLGDPITRWIDRDDQQIAKLVQLADETLARLDAVPEPAFV
ncbi:MULTISPECIES: YqaJ viral recombinase family protein [unclassified Pseudoclavibacter]|uniref:YqaJ viral recombinase family protein n=1 Tax=unclassified Pseudoclavibacter TaxID=2615177 RepID=UPI0013011FF9|nr:MULTISPECIES: YqaJ viral recombinase family protein [unclassified Pseudoclavibacter]KAB1657560.1 YqaJ viral recombinase family protein [Pseudoclavibacter sp. CFCC 11306]KAB1660568.1 YqaJ viral recombinase family protein [Pseudoclavibacter sp. CFCC 13796]